jgi:hypothetical protein
MVKLHEFVKYMNFESEEKVTELGEENLLFLYEDTKV